jgi:hypothetical protein
VNQRFPTLIRPSALPATELEKNMNANYLIAALVALAGPTLANAASPAAGVTRAQVYAEIVQARANGALPLSEANYLPYQFADATPVAREQAAAEPSRNRANDVFCRNEAECDRAPATARAASAQPAAAGRDVHICQNEAECDAAPHRDFTVTRAQVLAELYRARAAGEIPETEADNDVGRAALRSRAK